MTQLSDVLKSAKSTIFTVEFEKQLSAERIQQYLSSLKLSAKSKNEDEIVSEVMQGETCKIIGHLAKTEMFMGRSLVIDLEHGNTFKQVDHRTIKSIILRNVKYVLGKKSTLDQLVASDRKWNPTELAVGNFFSECQYYRVTKVEGSTVEAVVCNESQNIYIIPIQQVMKMESATVYNSQEPVTRSELVEILQNAKESIFTCKFHKKLTADDVRSHL